MTKSLDRPLAPVDEEHHAPEITYDEQFYPARPRRLRPSARRSLRRRISDRLSGDGDAVADNREYVEWLVEASMLTDANRLATQLSGQGSMWQNPYAHPDPRAALERASVWFTAYPLSFVTRKGETFLSALADPALWQAFREIGIDGVHTGPVKQAGGLNGRRLTPSVDGHFDRISMEVDPEFGSEDEFRRLCATAAEFEGTVIDDIVPGHTGKGADFRLAEMGHGDYPGIYHMVSIREEDWPLLPDVPDGRDSVNLDGFTEAALERAGYIIGRLQRVIFYEPGVKETNWSATRAVAGVDGVTRRWVYLHYFKEGQPSINWLDPSFAGMRLVIGDALHALADLGSGGLRLDANGFLGVEKTTEDAPAWSEGHPLSEAANHLIASMIRKMGGFSFQELNLAMDDIKAMGDSGADLSYDFVTRPAYHHALVTGDTEFLPADAEPEPRAGDRSRLARPRAAEPRRAHARAGALLDPPPRRPLRLPRRGADGLRARRAHPRRPQRQPDRPAHAVQPPLHAERHRLHDGDGDRGHARYRRPGRRSPPASASRSQRVHLLLAMFNALQPGVFALSGWDLSGMLTVDPAKVADLIADGDTRWINRGAHDLRGVDEPARAGRMPPARSLYGTLREQLADPASFASGLRAILAVRRRHGIATSVQVDVPSVSHRVRARAGPPARRRCAPRHGPQLRARDRLLHRPLRAAPA